MTPQEWAREKATRIVNAHNVEFEVEQALLEARDAALEEAATVFEKWDIENDPDDLYVGRVHLVNAVRSLKLKQENEK